MFTVPEWMIRELDAETESLAISRNAMLNVIIGNQLRARTRQDRGTL